ncbi:MAG: succinate dehydrogenase, cytochrome b556 subunit [Gammaproteobacteria bacterium]
MPSSTPSTAHKKRPVALSLSQFSFPVTAIASISHRLSGTVILLATLPFLWIVSTALHSDQGFEYAAHLLTYPWLSWFWALAFGSYIYHLFAGIRHLIMDLGFGGSLRAARISSYLVLTIGLAAFLFAITQLVT